MAQKNDYNYVTWHENKALYKIVVPSALPIFHLRERNILSF